MCQFAIRINSYSKIFTIKDVKLWNVMMTTIWNSSISVISVFKNRINNFYLTLAWTTRLCLLIFNVGTYISFYLKSVILLCVYIDIRSCTYIIYMFMYFFICMYLCMYELYMKFWFNFITYVQARYVASFFLFGSLEEITRYLLLFW